MMEEAQALDDVAQFYAVLHELEARTGPARLLADLKRQDLGATRGVYFFFQDGERRSGSGVGPRVVRVGTHGLKPASRSTLWGRLSQHRGSPAGGGNQRGSVFRRHVGRALMGAGLAPAAPGWGSGASATAAQCLAEVAVEAEVSRVIRGMRVLCLPVDDEPGPGSMRGSVERNAIALLTSASATALDPPSGSWLGRHAPAAPISSSGLWNVRHVGEAVDPGFLDGLAHLVSQAG